MNLLQRIDEWKARAPQQVAVRSGDRSLTYAELVDRSNALAAQLLQQLPADRSPIAVRGHKEPEMLIAFLGAVKAGHPYVPIDRSIPEERVARMLSIADVRLVLVPDRVRELSSSPADRSLSPVLPGDPYYIIFTSGSTGEPKGVVITLECLTSFVEWMLAEQQFVNQSEVFLNQAPFSFDLSVMDLYCSLATGGTLFTLDADQIVNPVRLFKSLAKSDITTWVSTPSFARWCLMEKTFNQTLLPQLQRFLFCGETLTPEVAVQLLDRFPLAAVWNTYGPTEATVATTSVSIDRATLERYSPLPVGYAKPDTHILIVDEHDQLLPIGARGEIIISGPNVSPGYLGRPDLNQRSFRSIDGQKTYHTGDLGHFLHGLLFFDGRLDHQIKLHGYRIELGDIEANLCQLPDVRAAVVLPITKHDQIESLAACVILKDRHGRSDFESSLLLRTELLKQLPAYMIPARFQFLDEFPMTANGKADRRKLSQLLQ